MRRTIDHRAVAAILLALSGLPFLLAGCGPSQPAPEPSPASAPVPAPPLVEVPLPARPEQPPQGDGGPAKGEPPLPKVDTIFGMIGPESFDQALAWLRGSQRDQLNALESLGRAEPYAPRQAEVARELSKLALRGNLLVAGKAVKPLSIWATKEEVPALLELLDARNGFYRPDTLAALARLKDERAVGRVAELLAEPIPSKEASRALILMGPMVEAEVRKYLKHDRLHVQKEAAHVLQRLGKSTRAEVPKGEPPLPKIQTRGGRMGPESYDQAVEWLGGNQLQQLVATGSLAKAKVYPARQAEVARELEKLLLGRDRLVAGKAADALATWATKEQVPGLVKAMEDAGGLVRPTLLETLARLKDERAVAPMAGLLTSFFTRAEASKALILMGPMVEDEVRKYLKHGDQKVREEAALVLSRIGKEGKDDGFIAALAGLKDTKTLGRGKALEWFALAEANHPRKAEAAALMANLLKDGDGFDKQGAAKALKTWATPAEVPTLIEAILDEALATIQNKPPLIQALARLKDKRAIPALAQTLAGPFYADEAAKALIAFGPSVEEEVLKSLKEDGWQPRTTACRVLKAVGTAKNLPGLQAALKKAEGEGRTGAGVVQATKAAIAAIQARR